MFFDLIPFSKRIFPDEEIFMKSVAEADPG
jgi:hypothetical protein